MPQVQDNSTRKLLFDLDLVVKQIVFSCCTGLFGTSIIITVALHYGHSADPNYLRKIWIWGTISLVNIGSRLIIYHQFRTDPNFDYLAMQKRRFIAAATSGLVWGFSGLLFLSEMDSVGRTFLIAILMALNFTGIPILFSSPASYLALWIPTWLPVILFEQVSSVRLTYICLAGIVLVSGLFVCFALKKALSDLFRVHEQYSERVATLNSDNTELKLFFLAASHDLSQPLTVIGHAINAFSGIERNKDTLQLIRSALAKQAQLIASIIHFEKITSGIDRANLKPINLNHVFSSAVAHTQYLAKSKQIALRYRPTSHLVIADRVLLERIIGNLIENALRYTQHGGVVVGARRKGDKVSIEVWDTGVGIKEEDKKNIFEIFKRVEETSAMHHGYGLGLSIVKRLTEKIDGNIMVQSRYGKGSVFKVLLPPSENGFVKKEHSFESDGLLHISLERMKVALLDDDIDILKATKAFLESESIEVQYATTSRELANKITEAQDIEVLITDWNLKTMSGRDAYNELKQIPDFNPVWVVLSGEIDNVSETRLKEEGVCVLRKPVNAEHLLQTLRLMRA
jgi:signal transduction histidine kinase/CheY-like chemotaxis protein